MYKRMGLYRCDIFFLTFLHKYQAFTSHAGDGGSTPGRDKPKPLKQVMTTQFPNARQYVRVSQVLRDDCYKGVVRVTVGVARERRREPSIGQNL